MNIYLKMIVFFITLLIPVIIFIEYRQHVNIRKCVTVQVEKVQCYVKRDRKFEVKGCSVELSNGFRTDVAMNVFKGDKFEYCTNSQFGPSISFINPKQDKP